MHSILADLEHAFVKHRAGDATEIELMRTFGQALGNPRISARVAATTRDGAWALVTRHEAGGQRFLFLPGGGIESGETAKEAAQRELLEETGLEIELKTPIALAVVHRAPTNLGGQWQAAFVFRARASKEIPGERAQWVPSDELVTGEQGGYFRAVLTEDLAVVIETSPPMAS